MVLEWDGGGATITYSTGVDEKVTHNYDADAYHIQPMHVYEECMREGG